MFTVIMIITNKYFALLLSTTVLIIIVWTTYHNLIPKEKSFIHRYSRYLEDKTWNRTTLVRLRLIAWLSVWFFLYIFISPYFDKPYILRQEIMKATCDSLHTTKWFQMRKMLSLVVGVTRSCHPKSSRWSFGSQTPLVKVLITCLIFPLHYN